MANSQCRHLYIGYYAYCLLSFILMLMSCTVSDRQDHWEQYYTNLCSFSSPRPLDVNLDGVDDVIIGAGSAEFEGSDSAIMALDGTDGKILWSHPGWDQMVGSAIFLHIDGDSVLDVLMGGRAGQLYALSGSTGRVLWQHFTREDLDAVHKLDSNLSNFYIPQVIPDQDGDLIHDLLISHGGDATKGVHDLNRPIGKLMVLSARNGSLLTSFDAPDGQEIYMSPLCVDLGDGRGATILFGTGGETFSGGFYRLPLAAMLLGDTSAAIELSVSKTRGYIAPPVVVDITGDEIMDIVVNSVDGTMQAFDGMSNEVLWKVTMPGAEVYSSLAVANFIGDETPDFFTSFGVGIYPNVEYSILLMVDGSSGKVAYLDTLGYLQIGSPLAHDLNEDGYAEGLMTVNKVDPSVSSDYYLSLYGTTNGLIAIDFSKDQAYSLLGPFKGINAAATPWIGDLDGDGQLDVLYTYMIDTVSYLPYHGMKVIREEFDFQLDTDIKWGSYMGSQYDGVYREQSQM